VGLYGKPNRKEGKNRGASKTGPVLCVLALFLVSTGLSAQENHELKLANLYYDEDDYAKAYTHFQNLILWGSAEFSGDVFYRYAYSHEQARGLDAPALTIYALSLHYFQKEGRADSLYARYAANKLGNGFTNLDDAAAAVLLEELRAGIDGERKALLYRRVDRLYGFFSRFSLFQWKIIASLAMTIPFFIGIVILKLRENPHPASKK
jgi:hypothetical protein